MELSVANKHTHERKVADFIIKKVKSQSVILKSENPSSKNGIMYSISKTEYENIINYELEAKRIPHITRMVVREFINRKLKPV
jgi:hypothetical protein